MATPKCPKCDGTRFEIQEAPVKHANYGHLFINCASCGCVVGTHEYFNVNAKLALLAQKLGVTLEE